MNDLEVWDVCKNCLDLEQYCECEKFEPIDREEDEAIEQSLWDTARFIQSLLDEGNRPTTIETSAMNTSEVQE